MALTPEEVAKIEEEEEIRAQARKKYAEPQEVMEIKSKKSHPVFNFIIVIGIILISISVFNGATHNKSESNTSNQAAVDTNVNELSSDDKQLLESIVSTPAVKIYKIYKAHLDSFGTNGNARQLTIDFEVPKQGSVVDWMTFSDVADKMMFEAIFPLSGNIQSVKLNSYVNTADSYGNTIRNEFTSVVMNRGVYQKINWEGFSDLRKVLDTTGKDVENYYSFSSFAKNSMSKRY